jgi:hypothetical protein
MSSLKRFSSFALLAFVGILAAFVAVAPDVARSVLVDVGGDRLAALLLGPGAGGVVFALNALPAAKNMTELAAMRNPPEGAVDVYPDTLYSTMVYPAAGVAIGTPLQFFQGAETNPRDISLTNVPNGFLVAQRFHALYAFVVPIVESGLNAGVVATSAAGRVRDLDRILKTNRGFVSYTYSVTNKVRGPFPLDAFGEMGAIMPDFGGSSAPAAGDAAVLNHVRTGASGGWPLNLIIYENEGFPFNMQWGVQTAISADLPLRLVLFGWRYVKNAA